MSMTYPNGTVLNYQYDNTEADKLSRVRTLDWDGTDVCRYSYLGTSTFAITDYLEPEVKLDYALGTGANRYDGFDRFGRVVNLPWNNDGSATMPGCGRLRRGQSRRSDASRGVSFAGVTLRVGSVSGFGVQLKGTGAKRLTEAID